MEKHKYVFFYISQYIYIYKDLCHSYNVWSVHFPSDFSSGHIDTVIKMNTSHMIINIVRSYFIVWSAIKHLKY